MSTLVRWRDGSDWKKCFEVHAHAKLYEIQPLPGGFQIAFCDCMMNAQMITIFHRLSFKFNHQIWCFSEGWTIRVSHEWQLKGKLQWICLVTFKQNGLPVSYHGHLNAIVQTKSNGSFIKIQQTLRGKKPCKIPMFGAVFQPILRVLPMAPRIATWRIAVMGRSGTRAVPAGSLGGNGSTQSTPMVITNHGRMYIHLLSVSH